MAVVCTQNFRDLEVFVSSTNSNQSQAGQVSANMVFISTGEF